MEDVKKELKGWKFYGYALTIIFGLSLAIMSWNIVQIQGELREAESALESAEESVESCMDSQTLLVARYNAVRELAKKALLLGEQMNQQLIEYRQQLAEPPPIH